MYDWVLKMPLVTVGVNAVVTVTLIEFTDRCYLLFLPLLSLYVFIVRARSSFPPTLSVMIIPLSLLCFSFDDNASVSNLNSLIMDF